MKIPALNILKNIKFPTLIIIALILNIAIFILIQRLVSQEHGFDINLIDRNFLDFTRVIEKLETKLKKTVKGSQLSNHLSFPKTRIPAKTITE